MSSFDDQRVIIAVLDGAPSGMTLEELCEATGIDRRALRPLMMSMDDRVTILRHTINSHGNRVAVWATVAPAKGYRYRYPLPFRAQDPIEKTPVLVMLIQSDSDGFRPHFSMIQCRFFPSKPSFSGIKLHFFRHSKLLQVYL